MPANGSKKKSRIRRRTKRALLPFTSLFTATVVAPPTTAPATPAAPIASTATVTAPAATVATATPTAASSSTPNREKIGKLFGSIHRASNLAQKGTVVSKEKRNNAYTDAQLEESWYQLIKIIPDQQDLHFLFGKLPQRNGNILVLGIDNIVVFNKINDLKASLEAQLHNDTANDFISIELKLVEGKSTPRTPREKARAMNESNGNLIKLFTSWGLRLQ